MLTMDTLVRNTTLSLSSRRRFDGYEELERNQGRVRTFSKRKKEAHHHHNRGMRASFSYRQHRAKQRQIFLKSYKLAPVDAIRRRSWSSEPKSNRLVLKVKKAVVSIVSLLRIGSVSSFLRSSCHSPSAVRASSPAPSVKGYMYWKILFITMNNSQDLYVMLVIFFNIYFLVVINSKIHIYNSFSMFIHISFAKYSHFFFHFWV